MLAASAPLRRVVRAYPARTSAAVVFGLVLSGIVMNAVLLQKGHHPAPLFGPALQRRAAQVPGSFVPMPLPRPAGGLSGSATGTIARSSEPLSGARPTAAVAPAPQGKDEIGQILRRDAKAQPDQGAAKPPAGEVLTAQRALQKLGYAVSPDGHMGAATRRALEAFAHERHLSAGSELSPKLLRELAGAAASRRG